MKTKVQAQRKFAQGAFVPPTVHNANVNIDRRIDVSPNKEKNIFHNKTSAKSLLDFVSFKNLHKHAQPIVLLERLEDRHTVGSKDQTSSTTVNPSTSKVSTNTVKPNELQQQASCTRVAQSQQIKSKSRIITPRLPMHLRSRVIVYNDSNKLLAYKNRNLIKDRKKVIVSKRKTRIRKQSRVKPRPQRSVEDFSIDDDQPLTFFRKETLRTRNTKRLKQKKLQHKRPKSVKYSEPSLRNKETLVRRILEVPDVITEIPDYVIAYVNDMHLMDIDNLPETLTSFNCDDEDQEPSSCLAQDAVPGTSSQFSDPGKETPISDLYQNPVPGTSSSHRDPVPSTSTASIYDDPVPGTSSSYQDPVRKTSCSNIYRNPIPGTSSSYKDPVPSTSKSSVYQDPVPGTSSIYDNPVAGTSQSFLLEESISICSSYKEEYELESAIDFEEVDGFKLQNDTEQEPKDYVAVAGPYNKIETTLLQQPPFYGIKEIDNWVSSRMTFVPPLAQVATRKSRKRNDQVLSTEIDLNICIGSKLSSMKAILEYGPSFYDCLCLNCANCKNIHELLNQHKQNTLKTMTDEENLRKANEESVSSANDNTSTLNIVISNVRGRDTGLESITIDDDDEKEIKTIDLTEDSNDVNFLKESPIQNVVQHEVLVHNDAHKDMPVQNDAQQEIPVRNGVQHEMPLQNDVQHEISEENDVQHEISEQNVVEDETTEQNVVHQESPDVIEIQEETNARRTSPRGRRKRGRGRTTNGPTTRQQAAANANAKRKKKDTNETIDPSLPIIVQRAELINAPVFYPSIQEFADPMTYLEQVMPSAAQFGLFKVVSPVGFQPPCTMGDNARFNVTNQYIARLFSRWGPAAREMCTIRAYLASQKVFFSRAPLLDGLEVNLPKLFHTVQRLGGLKAVLNKKKWTRVAEELKMKTVPNPDKKFDFLCLKYLLPYNTLTKRERQAMMVKVEQEWCKRSAKMLARVTNPLHQQKRLLGDSDPSDDDDDPDEDDVYAQALSEAEDCVVRGRNMCLGTFKRIAETALKMYFPPGDPPPTTAAVEDLYWSIVLLGTDHVSINSAFIDSGPEGYGFPKNKNAAYGKHPWNLKMLSSNNKNILRYLGLASGVTVPSIHVGMVFSTSCWHRDPHGLPWIEYMHEGPDKIWYGVPEGQSKNFRTAAEKLCPTSCQHKPIWLSSDIAMIPPNLLLDQNVRLSRVVQRPGEFIVVMPRAYSCSISTGFTISESVYFATNSFLQRVYPVFQELRESCEGSIFSLEQLLIAMSKDTRAPRYLQHQVHGYLNTIVNQELVYRNALAELKVPLQHVKRRVVLWNCRDDEECQICRTALYLSKVIGVFGKKSKLCQQHALRVLNDRKEDDKLDLTGIVLEVSMTYDELDEIILNLQKNLLSNW